MQVDPRLESDAAWRWFELAGTAEITEPSRRAIDAVWRVVVAVITIGLYLVVTKPSQRCTLKIIRRDNKEEVASFNFRHLEDATARAENIEYQLHHWDVQEFRRTNIIPKSAVVGPGKAERPSEFHWEPVARLD